MVGVEGLGGGGYVIVGQGRIQYGAEYLGTLLNPLAMVVVIVTWGISFWGVF